MAKVKTETAPTRKMSKKTRLQAFMHQEIFNAAAKAMEKANFAMVTMDDVAREMGGSKGTIYYYFSSREELMSSMAWHCYLVVRDALQPIADNKALSAVEKLEQMVRTEVLVMCQNWLMNRALWTNAWWSGLDDKNAQKIGKARTVYVKYLAGLLSEIDKGRDKKLNYETRARMIFYFIESVTGWFMGGGPLTAEQAADEAARLIMGGIKRPKS
jgi:AcrR family transcriptional regulator